MQNRQQFQEWFGHYPQNVQDVVYETLRIESRFLSLTARRGITDELRDVVRRSVENANDTRQNGTE